MRSIVVHGGAAGISWVKQRGCVTAANRGIRVLRKGGSSLDATVSSVKYMEDSGKFNAGVGAVLRIDGKTIEADAVVAISEGVLGGIEVLKNFKNPVLAALLVATKTPHLVMAGEGAADVARRYGLEEHPGPPPHVRKRYERMIRDIRKGIQRGDISKVAPGWTTEELTEILGLGNPKNSLSLRSLKTALESDTVGAVAFDGKVFALAASTGGSGAMKLGRVGDVARRGAGFQIGPDCAVLATGIGEEIIRLQGSQLVYDLIRGGRPPQEACDEVARNIFPSDVIVGFIALTRDAHGIVTNNSMASWPIIEDV